MSQEPFIQKLTLRNFRSIHNETVTFANPLFLVGRNGSGKSNFVDALAFISECMTGNLQSAIERRGGLGRIGYLDTSRDWPYISFRVDINISDANSVKGFYAFTLMVNSDRGYEVAREQCRIVSDNADSVWFNRTGGKIETSVMGISFVVSPMSLVLPLIGGTQDFASTYQALAEMRVYKIEPDRISGIQRQDDDASLKSDASNINSVLARLAKKAGRGRVNDLLQSIVPGVAPLPSDFVNGQGMLYFEQQRHHITSVFEAAAMSSGTLYALGLVVAALQEPAPSVIAIEEPELNIHPGALEAIGDILNIAAQRTQVVVTTHSPDLLDAKWIQPENLCVVEWEKGATHISELGSASVTALRQHLMGAGELLRANALDAAAPPAEDTSDLFQETLA